MEHFDEKILKAKRQLKEAETKKKEADKIEEELEKSIYDEDFTIYGKSVRFKTFDVLDSKVLIDMPEESEPLPDETIRQIYYLGNPPQYIYTSENQLFNVCFNLTEHAVPNEFVWDFLKAVKVIIERNGPGTRITDTKQWKKDNVNYASVEFISQAIDQPIYNLMFYASLDGKLLIGTINFISKYIKRLKKVAQEVVQSFCIKEQEEV